MSKNLKAVIGTNVWISGLVFGGNPEIILKLFIEGKIIVIVSEEIISELRRIITDKIPLFKPKLDLLEASIRKDAILVPLGNHTVTASRDPDDNKIIETGVSGNTTHIISGDDDLLTLKKYETIDIIKPTVFLTIYNQSQNKK